MRPPRSPLLEVPASRTGDCAHGYRLHMDPPGDPITVAAFGDRAIEVAVSRADRMVLVLVSPDMAAGFRTRLDAAATRVGRPVPRLAAWIPAAVDPQASGRPWSWRQRALTGKPLSTRCHPTRRTGSGWLGTPTPCGRRWPRTPRPGWTRSWWCPPQRATRQANGHRPPWPRFGNEPSGDSRAVRGGRRRARHHERGAPVGCFRGSAEGAASPASRCSATTAADGVGPRQ